MQQTSPALLLLLNQVAVTAQRQQHYPEVQAALQRTIVLLEANMGAKDARLVWPLTTLADIAVAQQQPAQAEPLLARALAIQEGVGSATDRRLVPILQRQVAVYGALGKKKAAEATGKRLASLQGSNGEHK